MKTNRMILGGFCLLAFGFASAASDLPELVTPRSVTAEATSVGGGDSENSLVTPDGKFVLFVSTANNLVTDTNNGALDSLIRPRMNVFLRNRADGTTTLVSVNTNGLGGNDDSLCTGISTNGRYALFESTASDLVPNDTNKVSDIFVRDMINGTTELISVSTNGGAANRASRDAVMTPDGRYVAFVSYAGNLATNDFDPIVEATDVFVRDRFSSTTTLVSTNGIAPSSFRRSDSPVITPDGRFVAFSSELLFLAFLTNSADIYLRDLVNETTTVVSADAWMFLALRPASSRIVSYNYVVSDDGQFVAFESSWSTGPLGPTNAAIFRYSLQTGGLDVVSSNVLASLGYKNLESLDMTPDGRFITFVGDINTGAGTHTHPVFIWDAQSGLVELVSADMNGMIETNAQCQSPSISADGQFVSFLSTATNLTTNTVAPNDYHLFVRNLTNGTTRLIDLGLDGSVSPKSILGASGLSPDGRFISFDCFDANLVAGDNNQAYDAFLFDLTVDTNELISVRALVLPSLTGMGNSGYAENCASDDGRYVAFSSAASDLSPSDTNRFFDVYVRDLLAGTNILVSVATNGFSPVSGYSTAASISADGRYVAFNSTADSLVPGDTNRQQDVFVRDLIGGTTSLVSVSSNGVPPAGDQFQLVAFSGDGRYVLFWAGVPNTGYGPLFLRDLQSGTTTAIFTNGSANFPCMSRDGKVVAYFLTAASQINIWRSNVTTQVTSARLPLALNVDGSRLAYVDVSSIWIRNLIANTNAFVSASAFTFVNRKVQFSQDGRWLVYPTPVANLPTDNNAMMDIYVFDFIGQTNQLISESFGSGVAPNGPSDYPAISPDGRFVAYRSRARNIVPGVTNGAGESYLYDRQTGITAVIGSSVAGGIGNARAQWPVFSGDSQTLFFRSFASDMIFQDFNLQADIFSWRLVSGDLVPAFAGQMIFAPTSGQSPTLTWPVISGKTYQVQFKDNLTDPAWLPLNGSVTIVGDHGFATDFAPNPTQRFYRVKAY